MSKRKRSSLHLVGDVSTSSVVSADTSGKTAKKAKSGVSPLAVAGRFTALALTISSPACASTTTHHYIYVRAHSSAPSADATSSRRSTALPSDRTLFVVNLPVDTTEAHLRALFSKAGPVEGVRFQAVGSQDNQTVQRDGDVESADEEDEEGVEELEIPSAVTEPASKKRRMGNSSRGAKGPPALVPLPPLDPRVAIASQPFLPTASSAHVIFLDASSLSKALDIIGSGALRAVWPDPWSKLRKTAADLREAELSADPTKAVGGKHRPRTAEEAALSANSLVSIDPPTGLAFLIARHDALRPGLPAVKAHADAAVAHYAYLRAHPPPGKRPGARIPGVTIGPDGELLDADGFTIVQRGGKYGRAKGEQGRGVQVARRWGPSAVDASEGDEGGKKKKSKELEDFYRFQLREKKREQLASLRANFEADKEKVRKLKESRKFKPF